MRGPVIARRSHERDQKGLARAPELQQAERSRSGTWNVRYRNDPEREGVQSLQDLIAAHAPAPGAAGSALRA